MIYSWLSACPNKMVPFKYHLRTRLVGIMLQISINILFWISLKISSLCLIVFFLCYDQFSPLIFTSKLLNTFSYVYTFLKYSKQNFPHAKQHCYQYLCSLLLLKYVLSFTASSVRSTRGRDEPILLFFQLLIFLAILSLLTYYAQYFVTSFNDV